MAYPILTTVDRVLRVLGYVDESLTEAMINDYIEYSSEYIQTKMRTTYPPSNPLFGTARACATYMAALCAVIRPSGGSTDGLDYTIDEITIKKSTQGKMRLSTATKLSKQGQTYLDGLATDVVDVPESNTGFYEGV